MPIYFGFVAGLKAAIVCWRMSINRLKTTGLGTRPRELIAASGSSGNTPSVGFLLADDSDPMTMAGATAQVFLGVRMACAQCHNHPFDKWRQKQFYELASFFGKTKQVEKSIEQKNVCYRGGRNEGTLAAGTPKAQGAFPGGPQVSVPR